MKKHLFKDFKGYAWGWIKNTGDREEACKSNSKPEEIIGIWGKVFREGITPAFYCETFLCEYAKNTGNWPEIPLTMLQEINREQTFRVAYNQKITTEVTVIPDALRLIITRMQLWKCKDCGHTFYTPVGKGVVWYKAFYGLIVRFVTRKPLRIQCTAPACKKVTAKKVKIVSKEARE